MIRGIKNKEKDMKLYIFRHGQTDGNVKNIVQGAGVDIELNAVGRSQAEQLGQTLKAEHLEAIYCSSMKRAKETAKIVATACNVPVIIMQGLEEVHFGEAEGMLSDEAHQKFADVFDIIHDPTNPNWMNVHVPGGESVKQSLDRIKRVLEHIVIESQRRGYQKIGIATHGALMFNLYQDKFDQDRKFDNCEYFTLEY